MKFAAAALALADDGPDGIELGNDYAASVLRRRDLIDLEVGSVLRRQNRSGQIDDRRAELALNDLAATPLCRAAHINLLGRCWGLRQNLTLYDALYVAFPRRSRSPCSPATAGSPGLSDRSATLKRSRP